MAKDQGKIQKLRVIMGKLRNTRNRHSLLDDVPRGMAELQRAVKLQQCAARVGFDWAAPEPVLDKFIEEVLEEAKGNRVGVRW